MLQLINFQGRILITFIYSHSLIREKKYMNTPFIELKLTNWKSIENLIGKIYKSKNIRSRRNYKYFHLYLIGIVPP